MSQSTLSLDYRDTVEVFVHKDLRCYFDANHYCAPARWVGQRLIAKADSSSVTLYEPQGVEIIRYARSFRRGQTVGAERFEADRVTGMPLDGKVEVIRRITEEFVSPPWRTPQHSTGGNQRLPRECFSLLFVFYSPMILIIKAALEQREGGGSGTHAATKAGSRFSGRLHHAQGLFTEL